MASRLAVALLALLASLAVSAAIYYYTGWLLFFLVVPFVPFLFRRHGERAADAERDRPAARAERTCPECGYASADPEVRYCPRDGTELED